MSCCQSMLRKTYHIKERKFVLDYIINLAQRYYNAFFAEGRYTAYLEGIGNTLIISLFAVLLGVLLGVLVAVVKYYRKGAQKSGDSGFGQAV